MPIATIMAIVNLDRRLYLVISSTPVIESTEQWSRD